MDDQMIDKFTAQAQRDGIVQLVVGAVIADGEKILFLKRPADDFMGGIWELPSGKVDQGERLDLALAREVKEETGLDVAEISAYLGHFDYTSGSGKPSRQFNFAVKATTISPVLLTEHDDFQWAAVDEEVPVTDAVKLVLAEYIA
ncbi:NUDIX hydrolase [Glycomyces sp. NPDC021274]|uniref:NUDIX hydrolase n=1 Tax=Glycomyces sp. NPDC021274 TaxID=3155120 RepID=UPI00340C69F4